jgi:hypothetical protein
VSEALVLAGEIAHATDPVGPRHAAGEPS